MLMALGDLPREVHKSDLEATTVKLAAGTLTAYARHHELYAPGVTRPLCPMGRVQQLLGLSLHWDILGCRLMVGPPSQERTLMYLLVHRGLPYMTSHQFACIRRALWDHVLGRRVFDQDYWMQVDSVVDTEPKNVPSAGRTGKHVQLTAAAESWALGSPEVAPSYIKETIALLDKLHVPLAYQRTNIWKVDNRPRSMLLGVYTRRGAGISKATTQYPHLLKAVQKLGDQRPKELRWHYTSVSICILEGLKLHKDHFNSNQKSVLIAMGDFDGGEFWVEDALGTEPPPEDSLVQPWQR